VIKSSVIGETDIEVFNQTSVHIDEIRSTNKIQTQNLDEIKYNLIDSVVLSIQSCQTMEEINSVKRSVSSINPTLSALKNYNKDNSFIVRDNTKKIKIDQQKRRFYSTRKKDLCVLQY
jgi:hypothetical protein